MSVFQIGKQMGASRTLETRGMPTTPWLLRTGEGLKNDTVTLTQVILSERGFMPLNPVDPLTHLLRSDFDELYEELPEWSILTPRLYPAADNLAESLEYELNLYLDRIEASKLPKAFGVVFDLVHNDDSFLNELLSFQPSIVVIRHPNIEDVSPRNVLARLLAIRGKVPPNIALYLPGSGGVGFQSFLIALGIDIVDDGAGYRLAARKRGIIDQQIHYLPDYDPSALVKINREAISQDFNSVVFHLDRNTLWTKLDKDMHTAPQVASLRHLLAHDPAFEMDLTKFAVSQDNPLAFTGEEGLYHPDVLHYQQRVEERYIEDAEVKVVILLPCSARKPYRESRSHQRYERAIQRGSRKKRSRVSIWSLTSPLGVVPRSLETVYPAQNYDIPVTGNWTHEEAQRTGSMLGRMLEKLADDVTIIVHSSKDYAPMVEVAKEFRDIEISWLADKSRSDEALTQLTTKLQNALEAFEVRDIGVKGAYLEARDTVTAIVRYVHGRDAHIEFDQEKVRVIGRPPRPIALQWNKRHWITWDKLAGKIKLHQDAVVMIGSQTCNWVEVNTEELRGSSLFNVGIKEASETISPGDEVIFFNSDRSKILGVGTANISGSAMSSVENGIGATIFKKFVEVLDQ